MQPAEINHTVDKQNLPPMLKLYLEYKAKYPDCLIFFQVGDFYELFFEDARSAAQVLNLTLTSRDKNSPDPIAMCVVPVGVIDNYLPRLIDQGYSAAIISQVADVTAKKGMVERKLERIVTPAVRILAGTEERGKIDYLAVVAIVPEREFSLAYTDVRTGIIQVLDRAPFPTLAAEIGKLNPKELILPRNIGERSIDRRSQWVRDIEQLLKQGSVLKFRGNHTAIQQLNQLAGYSGLSPLGREAVKGMACYLEEIIGLVKINEIQLTTESSRLGIDAASRDHLELVSNAKDGSTRGTLLSVLDGTVSLAGRKLLSNWILNPSMRLEQIQQRLVSVNFFKQNSEVRAQSFKLLTTLCDIERIATRIELGAVSPRELSALHSAILRSTELKLILDKLELPILLRELRAGITLSFDITTPLNVLIDNPPMTLNDGGIFKEGVDEELDRLRSIKGKGSAFMVDLEAREREATGINSLKVKFNNIFGYYIEVSNSNLSKVPERYIRRQTTANSERFITPELKSWENDIVSADAKLVERERNLFIELIKSLQPYVAELRKVSISLATLDVLAGLAEKAEQGNWCEPELMEEPLLEIVAGRHPVLDQMLGADFVPNNLNLNPQGKLVEIITGPNMGGKSTYLRQAACLVIMAQLGSFVPATRARIGLVDKIFTRIGAADNMAEGESTFMVEMRESAYILSLATNRSLVLIDEVGRGTATLDGLSLAQAILEWLVAKLQCRALFATHFHELTQLEKQFSNLGNLSVGSSEQGDEIVFTHQIVRGAASQSYGIEVARLAGLPNELLARAEELLNNRNKNPNISKQLSFFETKPLAKEIVKEKVRTVEPQDYQDLKLLKLELSQLEVNALTPLQALNHLASLVEKSKK